MTTTARRPAAPTPIPADCQIAGCEAPAVGEVRCAQVLLGRGCRDHLDWFLPAPGGPPHLVVLADGTTAVPSASAHLTATPEALVRHLRTQIGKAEKLRPRARDRFFGAMAAAIAPRYALASGTVSAQWVSAEVDLSPWQVLQRGVDLGACMEFAAAALGPDLVAYAGERWAGAQHLIGFGPVVNVRVVRAPLPPPSDPALRFAIRYAVGIPAN